MKIQVAVCVLVGLLPSLVFAGDEYESAKRLRSRMSGRVEFAKIKPVWAPDGSALYIEREGTIWRINTNDGSRRQAIDPARMNQHFGQGEVRIHRFSVDDTGAFVCLVSIGKTVQTLRVKDDEIEVVDPEDDCFALTPRAMTEHVKSGRGQGSTQLFFMNDSDESVEVEWVDSAGGRKKYATLDPGETHIQNTYAGHVFTAGNRAFYATRNDAVAYISAPFPSAKKQKPQSTDRAWKILFKGHNVFAKRHDSGKEIQLTTNGTAEWAYRGPADWSPDGRHFVAMRRTLGNPRRVHLIEAAPKEQLQPKLKSFSYLKPGDELDIKTPHLFDLETRKEIPLDESLYANPWRLTKFHWSKTGDRLFFVYNQRGHQTVRLLAIQAKTGKVATVLEETSPTFIDYSQKLYLRHLDATDEAIWMSERSGWNHVYLVDRKTGAVQPITTGEYVVRSVDHIDVEKRRLWITVLGIHPDQDPYYEHKVRVDFDGSNWVVLTQGDGMHKLNFSPDRQFYTDTWSRVNQPPVHELRRASDGKKVADLGKADASELLTVHPHLPEPFVAKGRDGKTDIYGVLYRPSHFDPTKRYPVIEAIYAGPQDYFVPKSFASYDSAQRMAERGFIVARIDGMGTNWRSKSFHDVCWKNLKDAGFPDRIAWLNAAAEKYPFMDLTRVGIFGGSAGGQNAMRAVIDHAEFYKVAAADCGCHDNRMDKVWWNEAWMGWPIDDSYAQSSNRDDAHKLGGKLLLTVGMLDDNVDPSSTLQVVEELIKADKDFDFIPFPSKGHGAGSSEYGQRRREQFFIRHLQQEP